MKRVLGLLLLGLQGSLFAQMDPLETNPMPYGYKEIRLGEEYANLSDLTLDRGVEEYLGVGWDGITNTGKGKCVKKCDVHVSGGQSSGYLRCAEVRTESELESLLRTDLKVLDIHKEKWQCKYHSLGDQIKYNLKITDNTITYVGIFYYDRGYAVINDFDTIEISEANKKKYRNNYDAFCELYGDGFVSRVNIGESLYVTCQIKVTSSDQTEYRALRDSIKVFFDGIKDPVSIETEKFLEAKKKLQNYQLTCVAYQTGEQWLVQPFSDKKGFEAINQKFQQYINDVSKSGRFSILHKYLKPYGSIIEKEGDGIGQKEIEMMQKWYELRSKIQEVKLGNLDDLEVNNACNIAIVAIQAEVEKCRTKHSEARPPKESDFSELQVKWRDMHTVNFHRAEWYPTGHVFTFTTKHDVGIIDLSKSLTKPAGYKVFDQRILGTCPLYSSNIGIPKHHMGKEGMSNFLTRDLKEAEGHPMKLIDPKLVGYLYSKPFPGTKPLFRVGADCVGVIVASGHKETANQCLFEYTTDENKANALLKTPWVMQDDGTQRTYTFTTKQMIGYVL